MVWNSVVWLYCERGTRTVYLAEPYNSLSSSLPIFVALIALWFYHKRPASQQNADHTLLIVLTFLTGFGSLSFHLFANQWSELAHLIPFVLFFAVYLSIALGRFLDIPPGWTSLTIGLLLLLTGAALTMTCIFIDIGLQPPWSVTAENVGGATSCLNGSLGFFPMALALALLGFLLAARRHKAARTVIIAACLFFISLVFHAIDHFACSTIRIQGRMIGTHFIWHILNALVMFILLRSSMLHQNKRLVQEIIPPNNARAKKL